MHFIHGSVCLFCACVFDVFSRLLVLNTSARDCLETNCVRNDLLCVEWDIKLTHSPMDTWYDWSVCGWNHEHNVWWRLVTLVIHDAFSCRQHVLPVSYFGLLFLNLLSASSELTLRNFGPCTNQFSLLLINFLQRYHVGFPTTVQVCGS